MTAITLELKLFTDKDADSSSIHIDSLILVHKGNHYRLKGGSGDTIHAFVQSIALYVLTVNKEHGTIGLNAYMSSEPSPINSFYLHTVKHIVSILGPKWEQLPAIEITQTLIDYLI